MVKDRRNKERESGRESESKSERETSISADVKKEPSRDWEKAEKLRPRRSNRIETCSMNFRNAM